MVLLVAIALVGAAVGLLLVGRGNAGPYILALLAVLAMIGVFSLFALAAGILRVAGKRHRRSPMLKAVVDERRRRHPGHRSARPRDLRQRRLSRSDRRQRCRRRAAGRAGVHRRSRRVGGGLSPAQGGARRPPRCRRRCGSPASRARPARWLRLRVRPLGDDAARRALTRVDRRRRDARPRAAGERLPGTAARHRLSRSRAGRLLLGRCATATSSISTPRSPTGSTTISRRSAPAG